MVELKMWVVPVAALVPMILGFIWYNPKVLGSAWMKHAGLTEEQINATSGGKMAMTFILSFIFANFLGFVLMGVTIHQLGFQSMLIGTLQGTDAAAASAAMEFLQQGLDTYGNAHRHFGHGALHGAILGVGVAFTIIATNHMFEKKSWKLIWINSLYWIITITLMGGVICELA